jgi:benzoate-CoA ligase
MTDASPSPHGSFAEPPAQFNFAAHLFDVNAARAQKIAYVDDHRTVSYAALEDEARRIAGALRGLGIHPEERVLLVMLDSADLPAVFLGALYAGIVPVVVNTLLTPDDYRYMLAHSRARAVIVSAPLHATLAEALAGAGRDDCLQIVARAPTEATRGPDDLRTLTAAAVPAAQPLATSRDDIAFWLYSSGSTGKPKGTVHTHANLYWTAQLYGKPILGIRETDVVFSAAKLFFAYGLGNALTFPLSVGATTVLMAERPTADAVLRRLVAHRPTVFCGVPTLYANLMASPQLPARGQVALRVCTSAGEALPADIAARFGAHFGCEILDGLGSTEMLHIFLSNRPGMTRPGTTGVPVPGYEVELRDEHGHAVAEGEVGDLYIKGPSSAVMYWSNREKSRATFLGEWVRSGDKYQRRGDGYYVYAGRSDDMLKVSGQYVSPIEVEMVLMQHEAVLETAVIGVEHDGLVKTCAFVVPKPGFAPGERLAAEMKAFVKARLAPHKYPREIHFVDDLPKTATGKIQRFRLREQARSAA